MPPRVPSGEKPRSRLTSRPPGAAIVETSWLPPRHAPASPTCAADYPIRLLFRCPGHADLLKEEDAPARRRRPPLSVSAGRRPRRRPPLGDGARRPDVLRRVAADAASALFELPDGEVVDAKTWRNCRRWSTTRSRKGDSDVAPPPSICSFGATTLAAAGWLATVVLRRRSASLRALIWTPRSADCSCCPRCRRSRPPGASSLARTGDCAGPGQAGPGSGSGAAASRRARMRSRPSGPRPPRLDVAVRRHHSSPIEDAARTGVSWGPAAFLLWMLVTAALWLRIASSHVRLSRVANGTSDSEDADADWVDLLDETRSALGISRTVR